MGPFNNSSKGDHLRAFTFCTRKVCRREMFPANVAGPEHASVKDVWPGISPCYQVKLGCRVF